MSKMSAARLRAIFKALKSMGKPKGFKNRDDHTVMFVGPNKGESGTRVYLHNEPGGVSASVELPDVPWTGDKAVALGAYVMEPIVSAGVKGKDWTLRLLRRSHGGLQVVDGLGVSQLSALDIEPGTRKVHDGEWRDFFTVDREILVSALESVIPAVSKDTARYGLNGVCFQPCLGRDPAPLQGADVLVVGTDGSQLAAYGMHARMALGVEPLGTAGDGFGFSVAEGVVSTAQVRRLLGREEAVMLLKALKLGDDDIVKVQASPKWTSLKLTFGSWVVTACLIDGEFPAWRMVIDVRNPETFGIPNLAGTLERLDGVRRWLGRQQYNRAGLKNSEAMVKVHAQRDALSSAMARTESREADLTGLFEMPEMTVGFSMKLLCSALRSHVGNGPVESVFSTAPLDPVRFSSGALLSVVMPMRLD